MSDTSLATVPQFAAYLREDVGLNDPTATLLLKVASGIIRDYLQLQLDAVTDDVILTEPVSDEAVVLLPELPVTDVSLVETWDGTQWNTVDPSTYSVSLRLGIITGLTNVSSASWPGAPESWRVTYSHGYAEIPMAIIGVTLGLAARQWAQPIGVESESIGGYSVKYAMQQDFTDIEQKAINRYINPRVA